MIGVLKLDTAYFPGSGPPDRQCSDCEHWHCIRSAGRCRKAAEMRRVSVLSLEPIPRTTAACKYFEQRPDLKQSELQ